MHGRERAPKANAQVRAAHSATHTHTHVASACDGARARARARAGRAISRRTRTATLPAFSSSATLILTSRLGAGVSSCFTWGG